MINNNNNIDNDNNNNNNNKTKIMITMMKIVLKIKIIKKYIYWKKWMISPYEWSFLTIAITVTTKTTPIKDKTLTVEERDKKDTYLLHPNYEMTTFSNMQLKHHVHEDHKEHMSLTYATSTVLFALKILPFQYGLLLWSPGHKSRSGHSADNVREIVSGYGLGLIVCSFRKIRCVLL